MPIGCDAHGSLDNTSALHRPHIDEHIEGFVVNPVRQAIAPRIPVLGFVDCLDFLVGGFPDVFRLAQPRCVFPLGYAA